MGDVPGKQWCKTAWEGESSMLFSLSLAKQSCRDGAVDRT